MLLLLVSALALVVTGFAVTSVLAPATQAVDTSLAAALFPSSTVPQQELRTRASVTDVGLTFRARVPGRVVGLRYYRGAHDNERHPAALWTAGGDMLRSAAFRPGDTVGWQRVEVRPARLTPGRDYVVSFHTSGWTLSATPGFFGKPYRSPALSGLAGVRGTAPSPRLAFPAGQPERTNYFVDVMFLPDASSPSGGGSGGTQAPTPGGPTTRPPPTAPTGSTVPVPATPSPTPPAATPASPVTTAPTLPPTSTPTGATPSSPAGGSGGSVPAGYPDASTTGVPAGTALTATTGDVTVRTAGTLIDAKDVRGCLTIDADRVTVTRTRIHCNGWYGIRVMPGRTGAVVQDTEIDGMGNADGVALGFDNYLARRLNIHNIGDGLRMGENVVIEDSYIHDLVYGNGSHNDGIQSDGGSNYVIRHNRIENSHDQTSAILLSTNIGRISDVVVDNNLMAGGGYTFYAGTDAGGPAQNVRATNNRFSRMFFPRGGYWGPVVGSQGAAVWTGNVWADTGAPVNS